jgi:serine/threonine protein kinase
MNEITSPARQRVEALRAEQLRRWQNGERVLVETYLASEPALCGDDEAVLDLLYHEFVLREELGETPGLEEYLGRFPQYEATLRRQLALHQALASPSLLSTAGGADTGGPAQAPAAAGGLPAIPGYEVLAELGRGGMGIVYKARHRNLGRLVALKMIRAGDGAAREELARLRGEAEAAARLQHPNIVQIYEVGEHAGRPFVALEYVAGGSLAQQLDGTPLPTRQAAALLVPLARAMQHAHERNLVHRDLKPANVLLSKIEDRGSRNEDREPQSPIRSSILDPRSSILKVTDFGLAKRLDADTVQTRSGVILGTPSYMPPEQAEGRGQQIGPAADIYALGAILYELLTGRPPFKGDTVLETIRQVASEEPVPPRRLQTRVPRDLETICLKCLEKEPRRRYGSARELAEELERFLAGEPIHARPAPAWERALKWGRRRPALAALLLVSGLALVGGVAGWASFTAQLQTEKEHAQEQEAEARRERDAARTQRERTEAILRIALAAVRDHAEVVTVGRAENVRKPNPGGVLYALARAYARSAAALKQESSLAAGDSGLLAEQYADSAVKLLANARDLGFFERPENVARVQADRDLDILRSRPTFQSLFSGGTAPSKKRGNGT